MDIPAVKPIQAAKTTVSNLVVSGGNKPKKTCADWVRDMRFSSGVNKTTVGVDTDQVTPDLLMATSRKLLGISRREQEDDPKDSLEFQRFYGPAEYFAEHIMRDGGKLGRNMLWKATNKGNLDFMQPGSLDQHVSDVFYNSMLAQMVDGSSPLELAHATYKTTRIGEGGVGDMQSAPDEMRLVQPSFFGYIDPVISPECYSADTELMTRSGWLRIADITADTELACLLDGRLEYHKAEALHEYDVTEELFCFETQKGVSYRVTGNHRMYTAYNDTLRSGVSCNYLIRSASEIHGKQRRVMTGGHKPLIIDESITEFRMPTVEAVIKKPQEPGMPPQGANLKNVEAVNIFDFAEYLGWYLSEGNVEIDYEHSKYHAIISQRRELHPDNWERINELCKRLPFGFGGSTDDKRISIGRKQLVMYLKQFGGSADKFIPEWIFNAPLKARKLFRYALLQGDGRGQRNLCTISKRLAEDFARLQFELGESVRITHEPEKRIAGHPGIWVVQWHKRTESTLRDKRHVKGTEKGYYKEKYSGKVYCPTVPGGLVYCRRDNHTGFWCGNSQRVGLDAYITKNCIKGSDGKLYAKFINAHTGKEELVDSVTAAKAVVAAPEMRKANTKSVFALGGPTGVRVVDRKSIDYYLPNADNVYSMAANLVPMFNGVKEMRLLMGCLHPDTLVFVSDKRREIRMLRAADIKASGQFVAGATDKGIPARFAVRNSVTKLPLRSRYFRKVLTESGRTFTVSLDHKCPVLRKGVIELVKAEDLKPGMVTLRSLFNDVSNRRTFVAEKLVNKDIALLIGCMCRHAKIEDGKLHVACIDRHLKQLIKALDRFKATDVNIIKASADFIELTFVCKPLEELFKNEIIEDRLKRTVPSCILSAKADVCASFMDGYTADPFLTGIDEVQSIWVLGIPNSGMQSALAFVVAKLGIDTDFRDAVKGGEATYALKLIQQEADFGALKTDRIMAVHAVSNAPVMIDIDVNDNMYTLANGIVTHNSKYAQQAVSLDNREAPLVRCVDTDSGKDMPTLAGKYLGAQFAKKSGRVLAVRRDRVDVQYDDGTKGSVPLYVNFPMNAKGFINSTAQLKAGDAFNKGQCIASSNYTDNDGVAAVGMNLRSGWLSWKGGTYEDGVTLSESAAKKLTSTTMYKTDVDLDKTIKLGKSNYMSWKPSEFKSEQMDKLDESGIVTPGTVLHKGDPMILAVRTAEPAPGTMGKRVLVDLSERWEHDHPGVVTDVVQTRKGVKVFATVTAPVEIGDKVAGCYDDETEIFTDRGFVPFNELIDTDKVAVLHNDYTATFEVPSARQKYLYNGKMVGYKTGHLDFCVTPAHRMMCIREDDYYTRGCRELQERQAGDVVGKRILMRAAANFDRVLDTEAVGDRCIEIPPFDTSRVRKKACIKGFDMKHVFKLNDFAKFLGIWLAEGESWRGKGTCMLRITQFENVTGGKERCAKLRELFDSMEIAYSQYKDQYFYIKNKPLWQLLDTMSGSYNKYIPEYCFNWPKEALTNLVDWFYMGDGEKTIVRDGSGRCATVSSRLANDLQRIYILLGKVSNISCTKASNARSGRCYRISSGDGDFKLLRNGWYESDYNGYVYCVTTSTGVVLTRHNGRIIWNGQCYGNKGVVAQILPDDQMPQDKDGNSLDILLSPLGLISRTNASQLHEAILGKIAKKTGAVQTIPQFYDGDLYKYVLDKAKQYGVSPDDDFTDPETGRKIKGVVNGYSYIYKLKHLAESKMSARGTDEYDQDEVPAGKGMTGSKRYGGLEQTALVGHDAFKAITDAKLIRGQSNSSFWRSIRTGSIPTMPGEPLVHKKFFAHLTGSGVNIRKTQKGISCFALASSDVDELAGPRELKSADTYEAKSFRPMDGGLFGQDVFGINGDKWAYIKLDEPLPNPVMEEPLARLLNMSEKDFEAVAAGEREVDGMKSSADLKKRLSEIDLKAESEKAKQLFKDAPMSKRDGALKRYVSIENMRRLGVKPSEYMLDKIPVLPPIYRPISSHSGLTMVADSNYLYKQMLEARDDMREAKDLPDEYAQKARANLYRKWKELTGLYEPENPKLKNKHVQGLLKWALGDSPKWSAWQRKVVGATVDTVGRGVVVPNPRIKLNELGIPVEMAFGMMAPFVERELVKRGYTPIDAMKQVKERTQIATDVLKEVVKTHPVQMNRAPTLHKYNVMAFQPVLTTGHAIHVNPSVVVPFNMDFDGDTANIHVPVSDEARAELRKKMFPERNLISVRDRKILYKPEKEYQQGLYIATRMKQGKGVSIGRFKTVDEAREAYRKGLIDVDDPIIIEK